CVLFVLYTQRLSKKKAELEAEKAEVNAWQNELNIYDNIELNSKRQGEDGIYEVYEHIDESYASIAGGNEYTPYTDLVYSYAVLNESKYGNLSYSDLSGNGTEEPDYVRMLRESRVYQHLVPPSSVKSKGGRVMIVRKDSQKKAKEVEPSYLEIHK